MPVIQADDQTELSYRVVGTGSHAVVLLHCWMSTGASWDPLIEHLSLRGLRLVIPDLRGAGASGPSRSRHGLERFARDVLAIAEAERLETFTLVGHSMGGLIAMRLAQEASERLRGLFLMCPVPPSGPDLSPSLRHLFHTSAGDPEKLGAILDLCCLQLPAAERERLMALAVALDPAFLRGSFEAWSRGLDDGLDRIRTPTVVLTTDDPYFPAALQQSEVVAQIPGARRCYLPGPGHFPLVERPQETAAIVESFLSGLSSGARAAPGPRASASTSSPREPMLAHRECGSLSGAPALSLPVPARSEGLLLRVVR